MHAPDFYIASNFISRAYMLTYIFPIGFVSFLAMFFLVCLSMFGVAICGITLSSAWNREYKNAACGVIIISCILLSFAGISFGETRIARKIVNASWNVEYSSTEYNLQKAIDHTSAFPSQVTPVNGTALEKSLSQRFDYIRDGDNRLKASDVTNIQTLSYKKDKNNLVTGVFIEFTMKDKEKALVLIDSVGTLSLFKALQNYKETSRHVDIIPAQAPNTVKKDFENSIRVH